MKLFTPGPIEMDPQTIKIGGIQQQYFRTSEFSKLMLECMNGLQNIVDAPKDSRVIFLTASGTGAMEATILNLFTEKDRLLIIEGGTFGRRFTEICNIHNIEIERITLKRDEAFNPKILKEYENLGITGMLVNVCETSTGQLYDMKAISKFCKQNNICLVADAISSFLCDSFSMKEFNVDAAIISSQKGLGLQPGMAYVLLTKEIFESRVKKNTVKSLYFRFTDYYPEILRGQTNFTPAIGVINQLHEKLERIQESGVDFYVDKCKSLAEYFRNSITNKTTFISTEYPLSNCVTPLYTNNYDARKIVDTLRDDYDIYVIPAAGDLEHTMLRVGHMSSQLSFEDIDMLISLFQKICAV